MSCRETTSSEGDLPKHFLLGLIRQPRTALSSASFLPRRETLAPPDRRANKAGFDNNFEYRLQGYFSGQTVCEPVSNSFYPEFSCRDINSFRSSSQIF
jgi:hypothetical protein